MAETETIPTKGDCDRLKKYHKGKLIKCKWIAEYRRRGWIGGGELIRFPGGCTMTPYTLTEAGLAAMRYYKQS